MIDKNIELTVEAIKYQDAKSLREISKIMSSLAVTEQHKDIVELAVITYALNKLCSKVHFGEKLGGIQEEVASALRAHDFDSALNVIERFDSEHGLFHGNLVGKAKIKVGARLYSHGLSLSTSASLTGASASDLQDYVGGTKADYSTKSVGVSDRIKVAKKVFGKNE